MASTSPVSEAFRAERADLRHRRWAKVAAVLVVGLVITALATVGTQVLHNQTENRLLKQHTREAATVFDVSIARNQSGLSSGARLVSNGFDPDEFRAVMEPLTGTGQPFAGVTVWLMDAAAPRLVYSLGQPLDLSTAPADRVNDVLGRAVATPGRMSIVGFLADTPRRIGYAFVAPAATIRYAVYAEGALPANAKGVTRSDEAFRELDFALYLGEETSDRLVISSVSSLPISSRKAVVTTAFGDSRLVLVTTPRDHLAGTFSMLLPWLVLALGLAVTLSSATVADRMLRRRDEAFALAEENSRLYGEQRQIAETLQRSLLPQKVSGPPGATVTARYWPAGVASAVGGDFYDLFPLDDRRWALVIGDVCGKGIEAAALTSVARHTIRAAAQHVTSPSEVLRWVHQAVLAYDPTTFCTACYGVMTVNADGHPERFEFALGGHAQPLLASSDGSVRSIGISGTLLGMVPAPTFADDVVELRSGDMLLLFTDGLTDAPAGEAMEVEELQLLLKEGRAGSPNELAERIRTLIDARRPVGGGDDTALLIVKVD